MRNHMWNQFKKLYQPYENVAIDEQIVIFQTMGQAYDSTC